MNKDTRKTVSMFSLLACLQLASTSAFAQKDWIKQSPFPVGTSLRWSTFLSPDFGYAVGDDQAFVETRDGGRTWMQVPDVHRDHAFREDPFNNIFFLDDQHGWVIGNNNEAWRTTDGGDSWMQMLDHPGGSYYHLDFVTPQLGWTGGNGSICRSEDGGRTWTPLFFYDEYGVVYGMDFLDTSFGAMCTNPVVHGAPVEGIYLTNDAGDNWTLAREGIYNGVALFSRSLIVAIEPGAILRSIDGGRSWTTQLADEEGFGEVHVIDADSIVVSGLEGSVWISDDQGMTWEKTHEGVGRLPGVWGVSFTSSQLGALAGPGGWLFRSEDGGQTWQSMNRGLGVIWDDLEMYDAKRGYAVSAAGYFAYTHDSGKHWTPGRLEVSGPLFGRDEGLNVVSVVDRDCVVAAGDGGIVFKSVDGGQTWESIGYPALPDLWINGVDFVTRDVGWVVGQALSLEPQLYRTTDGGLTWTRQGQSQMWGMYDCQFFDESEGWVAGSSEAIWKTEDGGNTWIEVEFPFTFSTPAFEIEFEPSQRQIGYVLQATSAVKRTGDGGQTWTESIVPGLDTGGWPVDVSIVDESLAWLVTNRGKTFKATTGLNWSRVHTGFMDRYGPFLGRVHATSESRVWVTGGDFQAQGLILTSEEPPGDLQFSQTALTRGEVTTFMVTGAEAEETVYFLYTLTGVGQGPSVPQLGGLHLDLLMPVVQLGTATADINGGALFNARVPSNAPLIDVHTQVVVRRGPGGGDSAKSNTVTSTILQ